MPLSNLIHSLVLPNAFIRIRGHKRIWIGWMLNCKTSQGWWPRISRIWFIVGILSIVSLSHQKPCFVSLSCCPPFSSVFHLIRSFSGSWSDFEACRIFRVIWEMNPPSIANKPDRLIWWPCGGSMVPLASLYSSFCSLYTGDSSGKDLVWTLTYIAFPR